MATAEKLRFTPLHKRHAELGGRLVPFAGWEMPVQYEGIRQEHLAVREAVGVFDVSHMGQIETEGPEAEAFLQRILSNDLTRLEPGGAQYSVLCREDGGVLDDLFTYRFADDSYLTVTNAANHEKDLAWFQRQAREFAVEIRDVASRYSMLAVQGPDARRLIDGLADEQLPARMRTAAVTIAGVPALVCGTGYTGEDGVEVLIDDPAKTVALWDALLEAGATPAGLGARDTLRLEACFHLYGNDLSEQRDPIGAGLGWCCKLNTDFIGSRVLETVAVEQRLVPFAFTGPGIPRDGNPVLVGGTSAGEVTSGGFSPCLGIGIGMAYVPAAVAEPGTAIEVEVRGKLRSAEIRRKPLYEKES